MIGTTVPGDESFCPFGHEDAVWPREAERLVTDPGILRQAAWRTHGPRALQIACREQLLELDHLQHPSAPHPLWARVEADQREHPYLAQVYVMACQGSYKIGKSRSPENRWRGLNLSNPCPVTLRGYWPETPYFTESSFHSWFSSARFKGEWFAATWEVQWFVDSMPAGYRLPRLTAAAAIEEARKLDLGSLR